MDFNSQICTTIKQSERLLDLGLKIETADMGLCVDTYVDNTPIVIGNWETRDTTLIDTPAWSLSRLIEMLPPYISSMDAVLIISKDGVSYDSDSALGKSVYFQEEDYGLFQNIIDCIEWLIKEGKLRKDYLKQ